MFSFREWGDRPGTRPHSGGDWYPSGIGPAPNDGQGAVAHSVAGGRSSGLLAGEDVGRDAELFLDPFDLCDRVACVGVLAELVSDGSEG